MNANGRVLGLRQIQRILLLEALQGRCKDSVNLNVFEVTSKGRCRWTISVELQENLPRVENI